MKTFFSNVTGYVMIILAGAIILGAGYFYYTFHRGDTADEAVADAARAALVAHNQSEAALNASLVKAQTGLQAALASLNRTSSAYATVGPSLMAATEPLFVEKVGAAGPSLSVKADAAAAAQLEAARAAIETVYIQWQAHPDSKPYQQQYAVVVEEYIAALKQAGADPAAIAEAEKQISDAAGSQPPAVDPAGNKDNPPSEGAGNDPAPSDPGSGPPNVEGQQAAVAEAQKQVDALQNAIDQSNAGGNGPDSGTSGSDGGSGPTDDGSSFPPPADPGSFSSDGGDGYFSPLGTSSDPGGGSGQQAGPKLIQGSNPLNGSI